MYVSVVLFPLGFDRRVLLMRFYGSEQSTQLMVREGEILTERWRGLKTYGVNRDERGVKKSVQKICVRYRSSERMERKTHRGVNRGA